MEIEYLTALQNNPNIGVDPIKGISESAIAVLEGLYNDGNPFPKVLKGLLFLGGDYCGVMDFGASEDQQDFQEYARRHIADASTTITRPFYVVEVISGDNFIFIYLDEGDNPPLYQTIPKRRKPLEIKTLGELTLKSDIELKIYRVNRGESIVLVTLCPLLFLPFNL